MGEPISSSVSPACQGLISKQQASLPAGCSSPAGSGSASISAPRVLSGPSYPQSRNPYLLRRARAHTTALAAKMSGLPLAQQTLQAGQVQHSSELKRSCYQCADAYRCEQGRSAVCLQQQGLTSVEYRWRKHAVSPPPCAMSPQHLFVSACVATRSGSRGHGRISSVSSSPIADWSVACF
jgi:hypothetical protein